MVPVDEAIRRERIRRATLGKPKLVVTCPHCGTSGGKSVMARWHFKNCKNNKKKIKVQLDEDQES